MLYYTIGGKKMKDEFPSIKYPYVKEIVKVPGKLEKAIRFQNDFKLSHRRLFYDYCEGMSVEGKPYNPWATFNEKIGNKVKILT